ncbi:MAG: hypothetical protein ABI972_10090 [Acidobacteriota bacterium]
MPALLYFIPAEPKNFRAPLPDLRNIRLQILFSTLAMAGAAAQPLSFTLLPAGDSAPAARVNGAIAYDESTRRAYMFGGLDSAARNDL